MSHRIAAPFKLHPLALVASAALLALAAPAAQAASKYWACANTVAWNTANCWKTSAGVVTTAPDTGDYAYLDNATTTARTVTFGFNPGKVYDYTEIKASSSGNMTLNINSASSNFSSDYIDIVAAAAGSASITQSAGVLTAATRLKMTGNAANANAKSQYILSGGALNTELLEMRGLGSMSFSQTGGVNNAKNIFLSSDALASYAMSGSSTLNTNYVSLGFLQGSDLYKGQFSQSSGTHNNQYGIGVGAGSQYLLSGSGKVVSGSGITVSADGLFNQNGGTVSGGSQSAINGSGSYKIAGSSSFTGDKLLISDAGSFLHGAGSVTITNMLSVFGPGAAYHLSGTGILNSAAVGVGSINGAGASFNQSGGTHTITGDLALSGYVNGFYKLQGGSLSSNRTIVGDKTIGTFEQSAGSHQTTAFIVGQADGGDGQVNLSGGVLNANNASIGAAGKGSFAQTGGSFVVAGSTQLGGAASGTYTLSGGLLNTVSLNINANGKLVFDGGSMTGGVINQNGKLWVSKDGGTSANIKLGSSSITQIDATFTNSGTLTVTRSLVADHSVIGSGTLYNHGVGTITGQGSILANVNNAGTLQSKGGDLTLAGASFVNSGKLRNGVGSNVYVNAGSVSNNGNIDVNSAGAVVFDANLGNQSGKVVTLLGGTLATPKLSNFAGGTVTGFGTLSGDLRNLGNVDFYGPTNIVGNVSNEAGADFLVRNNQTLITGDLVNNGTIRTIKGKVVFEGTLTNNGAYISDPSENHFSNLIVNEQGFLVGETGDSFIFSGNFINHSAQASQWQTGAASLVFAGPGSKTMLLAGEELGFSAAGSQNNFSWGELALAGGAHLALADGNASIGAALYVGRVTGVALAGGAVSNITGNGFNIYYDASLGDNAYLGGQTFALQDGGVLTAMAPVPEPASYALLFAGLALIGVHCRRRMQ
ncbi:PEP-CTERM sorting domain-containing protein [Roseateles oligotrophus]|uniref:PEP-CTERM sorting domain-containing protein n=1 Tax=Roseateles oligotrophus TaxID=1769250 RepID=A0ABT2YED6_9BURK|nr:PEP-CTERM sorting domain-containing protein [Roseateles oligotrophus]MCV2368389.1 PEP-CTERM sorting domain-containing protein [Roseateles oligotrophus]